MRSRRGVPLTILLTALATAMTVNCRDVDERGPSVSRNVDTVSSKTGQLAEPRDSLRLLLAARPGDRDVALEPIAVLDSLGVFHDPPYTLETDSGRLLVDTHLAPGMRYFAGSGGMITRPVEISTSGQNECFGLRARARYLRDNARLRATGVALRDAIATGPFLATPTDGDEQVARAAAVALLRRNGVTQAAIETIEWGPTRVVVVDGASTLVAYGAVPGDEAPAFLVAVDTSRQATPFTIFDDASYVNRRRPELFDATDLDGDGAPELILLNRYYESWSYSILRRRGGRWQVVHDGGGSGC